ncbi:MAG TPA: beta/gamma crystallin-related protein [Burkholderiaceae bacterium]|nr:beta/gamma crystallin-related protein [Burkholderiaceae bacterium]
MNQLSKLALAVAGVAFACQAAAQVTLYEHDGFHGRSFTTERTINNLERFGFNDRSSSVVVRGNRWERWEVCEERRFQGRCAILRRGEYPSLAAMGLNDRITSVRYVGRNARVDDDRYAPEAPPPRRSEILFFENEGFEGRSFMADAAVPDFRGSGFNDRASSAVVRGERWEVCEDVRYSGRCVILRPGQYGSLAAMGLNDRVSSVRAVGSSARIDDRRYAPQPVVGYDYGRRPDERLYEANITSVRAVVDNSGQRCWVEREQVTQERSGTNVPGALLGAVIGGVLGHQVGGGSGKDVATGIGVVAGAAIGGNSGRGQQQTTTQDVQRCTSAPHAARPTYWDVTYNFRGTDHRVQMTTPPGATVTVNERGEPRA